MFNKQNNNFARALRFFCTFLSCFCTTLTRKCLISRFKEDVNKLRRNFISLSELEYGHLTVRSGGFAYIWQSKWAGIIAVKTKRTQIHLLSDVPVAVESLDLKVHNRGVNATTRATKTSLTKWICAASNFIALIPSRLIRQMLANSFRVEF